MTLDEAIKHCEEVAEREQQKGYYANTEANQSTEYGTKCYECAKEHRQLAEWLKELKTHREIHEILLQTLVDFDLDMCCEDLTDDAEESKICEECCNNQCLNCWVRWAKMKAREVNADDK